MTQITFNITIVVIMLITILIFLFLLPYEYNKTFEKGKTVFRVICTILSIAVFSLMICSLDYSKETNISGEIKEIQEIGSYAGSYNRYRIIIIDDGEVREFQSILPVDAKSMEHIKDIKVGDQVKIHGSSIIDVFFYCVEKTKTEDGSGNG